ncbi:MAG: hypothetical protein PHU45_02820 [Bacilli bacterium]|nr:hypothetical protein [Bacilli bacterium]
MKITAFPKRIRDKIAEVVLYSVIYLDENSLRKAKVKTTSIMAEIEKKRLIKAGFTVIEIKKIVKKNDEIDINFNDEDVEQIKKEMEEIK